MDELLRLDPANEKLIELLLRLECYVRRVFGLPLTSTETEFQSTLKLFSNSGYNEQLTISRLVFTNYLYDSYLRLLISGRSNLVQSFDHVGTLTFVWSLNRACRLDPSLRQAVDVRQFSEKLDNLRRASNIDILMDDSIMFLERAFNDIRNRSGDECTNDIDAVDRNDVDTLNRMKTFYDVELENRLFDHTDHYDEAFVPSYRFCDSRLLAFNMSRYIGHTMRENIRSLYRYISRLIDDPHACPCVVIFNLFIRDNYRMYHSKSLRQSSFVSVRRTNGDEIKLGYMIVTNNFPRVNSWFKSINNQLVKKSGKNCIQHLDTFVRLMVVLSGQYSNDVVPSQNRGGGLSLLSSSNVQRRVGSDKWWRRKSVKRLSGKRYVDNGNDGGNETDKDSDDFVDRNNDRNNNSKNNNFNICSNDDNGDDDDDVNFKNNKFDNNDINFNKKYNVKRRNKKNISENCKGNKNMGKLKTCRKKRCQPLRSQLQQQRLGTRITLSNLYRNVDDVYILSELCNTAYNSCKHLHVERTYEQLRSNDESATLIRLCLDCGKHV